MSGVVLRCPNCGTVQPTSGECEACREAQVRYFCTNHAPGIWLDTPACLQCGARFGDPATLREAPPPPPELKEPRTTRMADPPADLSGDDGDLGPWEVRGSARRRGSSGDAPPGVDPARILLAVLGAAARARRGRGESTGYEGYAPEPRRGGGCLGRLLMLILLLFALFLIAPIFLGALLGLG
jgi:hypothetical protein